jgi:hypothetical protein
MVKTFLHLNASFALGLYCAVMVNSFSMAMPVHVLFTFVAVGGLSFIIVALLRAFSYRVHENTALSPAQLDIQIRDSSVGQRAELRIRTLLSPRPGEDSVEDVINRVNRASKVFLIVRLGGVIIVYASLMIWFIWLMAHPISFKTNDLEPQSEPMTRRITIEIPYGVPMLISLIGAGALAWIWIRWSSRYSVLTDELWFNATIWPAWLPFSDRTPSVPITRLEFAEIEQGALGKLFNYGTFTADTGSEIDAAFQRFPGMPDPAGFRGSANSLRPRTYR